jgi:hypothetical protein
MTFFAQRLMDTGDVGMSGDRFLKLPVLLGVLLAILAGPWLQAATVAYGSGPELAGYSDFYYKYSGVSTPTADKPQSKLWFNDGLWWASMFNNTNSPRPAFHIYKLDRTTQSWSDTGTEIDSRPTSQGDFLWDNNARKLYVVSGNTGIDGWYMRFSYDANQKIYTRDFNPIVVRSGGAESISIDKDTTGKLWITYTRGLQVYVNRSTTSETVWGTPFVVPGARTLDGDDISGIVAYRDANGSSIGVLWSNHNSPSSMYFSYHKDGDPDTTWQPIETIYSATCAADDHINLKSLQADASGTIYAAVKTSFGDSGCGSSSSSPLIRLVVRKPNNQWAVTTFGTVGDDHTRPIVMLDTTNRKVYMFATSPTSGNGSIYMKSTSMDNPDFSNQAGLGTPFIKSTTYTDINNATSTKQTVDAYSGLVVLAADESKSWYLHGYQSLGTPAPRLTFSRHPSSTTIGAPFATQPIVTAQDSQGNTSTSFNGPVTLAIKSGTGTAGAALTGGVTVNAVAGVATFSGISINMVGSGYQLTASAADFVSATSAALDVSKANQTITFAPIPVKRYADPPFTVSATSSAGLTVSFSDPKANDACKVIGSTVQITNIGACTVRASQPGDANVNPATADTTFTIEKANQTITFGTVQRIDQHTFNISVAASSGLPVSLSVTGSCALSGAKVTITGTSLCTVLANQAGNTLYNAAPQASKVVQMNYVLYLSLLIR